MVFFDDGFAESKTLDAESLLAMNAFVLVTTHFQALGQVQVLMVVGIVTSPSRLSLQDEGMDVFG